MLRDAPPPSKVARYSETQEVLYTRNTTYHANLLLNWEGEDSDAGTAIAFAKEVLRKYESSDRPVFFPLRDHSPGIDYVDGFVNPLSTSRFTVVVLTEGFLTNKWGRYCQKLALKQCIEGNSERFIPVAIGLAKSQIPKELSTLRIIHFDLDFWKNETAWQLLGRSLLHNGLKKSIDRQNINENVDIEGLLCTDIKETYRLQFSKMPKKPWEDDAVLQLEEMYTRLALESSKSIGAIEKLEPVENFSDIFTVNLENRPPTRLHLQGVAGSGKSTFCQKLAMDWSLEKDNALTQFKLFFFLRLHKVGRNATLEGTVRDQLLSTDVLERVSLPEIHNYLRAHKKDVFFVLDGYDEYLGQSEDINKLIAGDLLRGSTILLTTRPTCQSPHMWEKRLHLLGFDEHSQKQYISKYFPDVSNTVLSEIKSRGLGNIATVPMLLQILCLTNISGLSIQNKLSDIYSKLFQCLHQRYMKRNSITVDLKTIIDTIAPFAYRDLKMGHVQLQVGSLESEALHNVEHAIGMGILAKEKSHDHLVTEPVICYMHKSFQEYLAAIFVVSTRGPGIQEVIHHCCSAMDILDMADLLVFILGLSNDDQVTDVLLQHIDKVARELEVHSWDDIRNIVNLGNVQFRCLRNIKNSYSNLLCHSICFIEGQVDENLHLLDQVSQHNSELCPTVLSLTGIPFIGSKHGRLHIPLSQSSSKQLTIKYNNISSLLFTHPKEEHMASDIYAKNMEWLQCLPKLQVLVAYDVDFSACYGTSQRPDSHNVSPEHFSDGKPPDVPLKCVWLTNCRLCPPGPTARHLLSSIAQSLSAINVLILIGCELPSGYLVSCINCSPAPNLKTLLWHHPVASDNYTDEDSQVLGWALTSKNLETLVYEPNSAEGLHDVLQNANPGNIKHLYVGRMQCVVGEFSSWIPRATNLKLLKLACWPGLGLLLKEGSLPSCLQQLELLYLQNLTLNDVNALQNVVLQLPNLKKLSLRGDKVNEDVGEVVVELIQTLIDGDISVRLSPDQAAGLPLDDRLLQVVEVNDLTIFTEVLLEIQAQALVSPLQSK